MRPHKKPDLGDKYGMASNLACAAGDSSVLFVIGVPVFVAFLFTNLVGAMYFFGGRGFSIFTNSIYDTLASSSLATIALFI
ncbi:MULTISPECIES: hypothetical protein [unclassified Halomonas]|uniref:hypothetical protein n=1 Tax=unclassified Halomonas TaxID=2609666 RepID=UPI001F3BB68A|nr:MULTISPECIES: hypothetical protein [unclassified Halomonas]